MKKAFFGAILILALYSCKSKFSTEEAQSYYEKIQVVTSRNKIEIEKLNHLLNVYCKETIVNDSFPMEQTRLFELRELNKQSILSLTEGIKTIELLPDPIAENDIKNGSLTYLNMVLSFSQVTLPASIELFAGDELKSEDIDKVLKMKNAGEKLQEKGKEYDILINNYFKEFDIPVSDLK